MINSKRGMAYGQMFLLVVSVIAFGFLVGGVAGQEGGFIPGTDIFIESSAVGGDIQGAGLVNTPIPTGGGATPPPAPATSGGGGGIVAGVFKGQAFGTKGFAGTFLGPIFSGAIWGAIVGGIAFFGAKLFGLNDKQAKSIGQGVGAGTFVGTSLYFSGQNAVAAGGAYTPFLTTPLAATLWGVGVGATIIILTYKKEKKEIVKFECLPWEPPLGGSKCEECNKDTLRPCSEYRCKSLGQACEIVNPGTEEELCVWVGKGDTTAPRMQPWEEVLGPGELKYIPDNTIRQPNTGVKIVRPVGKGCLQAYTPLRFGIITDEPAQCRADVLNVAENFDKMESVFGDNLFRYNHSIELNVPNPFTQENGDNVIPEIHNDGTYTIWTRCIDANGNGKDAGAFAFRFCVDPAPDTEAPKIVGSLIENGKPVRFNVDKVPIEVYINEPAECKWSREDKAYESMENSMNCDTNSFRFNANLNYVCSGDLTNVKNREDNKYYFRCLDMSTAPTGRNVMRTSYELTLRGTEELTIVKAGPSGTIQGSTSVVEVPLTVETAHGANEGASICYFSSIEGDTRPTAMETEPVFEHNQTIYIGSGDYNYYYSCIDEGGNLAKTSVSFSVEVDTSVPLISRVLRDNDNLKVVTTEDAQCVYSETNCNYNFAEGLPLTYVNPTVRNIHVTAWNQEITYYVKCRDLQGNQPRPDSCSIVVQGTEL